MLCCELWPAATVLNFGLLRSTGHPKAFWGLWTSEKLRKSIAWAKASCLCGLSSERGLGQACEFDDTGSQSITRVGQEQC